MGQAAWGACRGRAGLVVQRGLPGPGGQVAAGGELGHVDAGLGDGVLGGAPLSARYGFCLLEPFLARGLRERHHSGNRGLRQALARVLEAAINGPWVPAPGVRLTGGLMQRPQGKRRHGRYRQLFPAGTAPRERHRGPTEIVSSAWARDDRLEIGRRPPTLRVPCLAVSATTISTTLENCQHPLTLQKKSRHQCPTAGQPVAG
jgi:hypothetical protein